ncbi:AraC family transcriptional regulator [Pararobbsia silviterrae]|uniref:AraC family transcriptional regulator n=1 Tax=Pararobbsia silviterrae TaxID=1792498 RepID=A0A494Y2F6_9BURK|nr:helix-turn-helix transcriptional regulator [Pararobbsia silviterrae]RKP54627.1 AraC family transcriptional regulator [Pararobbsia silviterrae]
MEAATHAPHLDIPERYAPTLEHPVRVRSRPMDADTAFGYHQHPWAQVAYTSEGVIRIEVQDTTWIVPPSRAIWIPARIEHDAQIVEPAYLRTLYIDESVIPPALDQCRVLEVSPLLRELIVALDTRAPVDPARERLLGRLILDEIMRSEPLPLGVPLPSDKRLRALCESIIANPAAGDSLEQLAVDVGASVRTIARLFRSELGSSFSEWRQQAVLAHAIPLLSQGLPLSHVANELGYTSQSAFTAMFRRAFGKSPRAFFAKDSS